MVAGLGGRNVGPFGGRAKDSRSMRSSGRKNNGAASNVVHRALDRQCRNRLTMVGFTISAGFVGQYGFTCSMSFSRPDKHPPSLQDNAINERRQDAVAERKVEQLQAKLQAKNEVVAELLQEHVQKKSELGELCTLGKDLKLMQA
jgi:hypothetical protein